MRWRVRSAALRSGRSQGVGPVLTQTIVPKAEGMSPVPCYAVDRTEEAPPLRSHPALSPTPFFLMTSKHHDAHHSRRWLILALLGLAQLMVVLDATIVNIALPSAQ